MRVILVSLLAVAALGAHAEWRQPRVVDLNAAGALDQVAADNPSHHRLIVAIMRTVGEQSCEEALKLYRARHDAGLDCSPFMLKTSFPPKRHVSIHVDNVRYVVNVVIDVPARRMPAR